MKTITYNQYQEKWQKFLKSICPEFSHKSRTSYFGVIDISYYPKKEFKEKLLTEFQKQYAGYYLIFTSSGIKPYPKYKIQ